MNLAFGHPLWTLGGAAAFAAYNTLARIGFRWLAGAKTGSQTTPTLLVLRSFSIGATANGCSTPSDGYGAASEACR